MNLSEGNIFEAMRLVLPEHRELMSDIEKMHQRTKRPTLAEDVMIEFEYLWKEAWHHQLPLSIVLFDPMRERVVSGIPLTSQNPLRLRTEHGCIMIQQEDILRINRL